MYKVNYGAVREQQRTLKNSKHNYYFIIYLFIIKEYYWLLKI